MRTRRHPDDRVAELTRRRIAALTGDPVTPAPTPAPVSAPVSSVPVAVSGPVRPVRGRHARRPVPPAARLVAWTGDRLPEPLRGRVHLGSAQLGLVALVVAVGVLATAWWLLRSSGGAGGVAVPAAVAPALVDPGTTSGPSPTGRASGAAGAATRTLVVDVAGRVRRPGIAVLPAGSRVVDAVKAAGGARPGVDLSSVNLARPLVDGEQVLVGGPAGGAAPAAGHGSGAAGAGALVNLNTADATTLESLPGVGPVTAAAIVQWRTEHGGFTAVEELLEVSGIGDATLAQISPHVTL